VARFHPVIDGNKGTAWKLMVLMFGVNGYRHDFSTDAAFDLVVGVASAMSLEVSAEMIAMHLGGSHRACGLSGWAGAGSGEFVVGTLSASWLERAGVQLEPHRWHSVSTGQHTD
jgi:hypothetical protein